MVPKGYKHSEESKLRMSNAQMGHLGYTKGRHLSEEHKRRISESAKGKNKGRKRPDMSGPTSPVKRPEVRKKISVALKGRPKSKEHKRKLSEANKGKKLSAETRKKISEANKGRTWSEEQKRKFIKNHSPPWLGKHLSEEHKRKISKGSPHLSGEDNPMYGVKLSDERKKKISEKVKGSNNPMYGKMGEMHPAFGRPHTEDEKKRIRDANKKLWKDPAYREKVIKEMIKSRKIRPNKLESTLYDILKRMLPNEYKYNDGWFILGGKVPDFPNVNGQKKLIEFYGDYWHRNDNPQDRIDYLKQFGYDTLIIWERELKDKVVLVNKILEFHKR